MLVRCRWDEGAGVDIEMVLETRRAELRQADGRRIAGTAIRYGDVAVMPWGSERFEPRAFSPIGDVMLNSQHERTTPLARTGGAGLVLRDSATALELEATLPSTRAADDVLELVKTGVLRGLSIEFEPLGEHLEGNVRIVDRARLAAVAIVDTPAYPASEVEARRAVLEVRKPIGARGDRGRLRSRIPYGAGLQCSCHVGEPDEVAFKRGAFDAAMRDKDDVIAVLKDYSGPLASLKRGTLRTRETDAGLEVEIALPDTQAGRDLVAVSGSVPLVVRPLFTQAESSFTEAGGVATYTQVALRAFLIGATDRSEGWPEAIVEGPLRAARRRVWF